MICSNMDGPRNDHTKWSQRKTDIIWYYLYVESKKYDINKLMYKTEIDPQTQKQAYGYQREKGVVDNLGIWD